MKHAIKKLVVFDGCTRICVCQKAIQPFRRKKRKVVMVVVFEGGEGKEGESDLLFVT